MRSLIFIAILILVPAVSTAAPETADDYAKLIAQHWPHAPLRSEQRQWLAQQSIHSLQSCHQTGGDLVGCHQQIREGLREVIGLEPRTAELAAVWK